MILMLLKALELPVSSIFVFSLAGSCHLKLLINVQSNDVNGARSPIEKPWMWMSETWGLQLSIPPTLIMILNMMSDSWTTAKSATHLGSNHRTQVVPPYLEHGLTTNTYCYW